MKIPPKADIRSVLTEIVFAMVVEELAMKLGRRLRIGHSCAQCGAPTGRHRPVRRLAGAIITELAAEGAAGIYSQQRRMTAAVDKMVLDSQVREHPPIPHQRPAPATTATAGSRRAAR